jgi:hypothetical protein
MVGQLTANLLSRTHEVTARIDRRHLFAVANVCVEQRAAHVARVAAFSTPASALAGHDKSLEKPEDMSRITGRRTRHEN